jgi:group II intron reverse transcriptase/maturase/CRISPR-associated endonuclease Cas1
VFEVGLEARVAALAASIASGTYRPGLLARRILTKKDGGFRAIGVANVCDRVLQTAAGQWLQARFEPLFRPMSFGYRPHLGPQRAALHAARLAASFTHVVNTDIERFFDTVDHGILMRLLAEQEIGQRDRDLLLAWLRATPLDRGTLLATVKGLPQGLPISPPLANLYLDEFDSRMGEQGFEHVRFADDFVVFASSEEDAIRARDWLASYLRSERRLALKATKTSVGLVAGGFDFVGFRIDAGGLGLQRGAAARFKGELSTRLEGLPTGFSESAKRVNDLVRGWRAYYGDLSTQLNEQLSRLDESRRRHTAAALEAAGRPAVMLESAFEALCVQGTGGLPGAYGAMSSVVELAHGEPASPPPASRPVARASRRRADVRALAIGMGQRPWLTETGDLVVPTHGAFLARAGLTLVVKRKRQTLLQLPIAEVKHVSIVGQGVAVSSSAIAACVEHGIRIWFSSRRGRSLAQVNPSHAPLAAGAVRALIRAARTRFGAELVTDLLIAKLKNQRALLLYHAKRPTRSADVRDVLRRAAAAIRASLADLRAVQAPLRTGRQAFFLIEARAAASYWSAFATLVPAAIAFPGRRGRGATDAVNSLLNYGYQRLLNLVWASIDRVGLVPWLGILHTGRRRSPALVLDLMEAFRPLAVDRVVLGLLGRGFMPQQRDDGRLRLSTVTTFERALATNLSRVDRSGHSLEKRIRLQTAEFKRALEHKRRFHAEVMEW